MRPTLPLAILLLAGSGASAQLSILPNVGIERSSSSFSINDFRYSPVATQLAPKASVRLDYRFKTGHGPFVGAGTSPALVDINFRDAATVKDNFTTTTKQLQWRLEGGYQYTSPAIFFKKKPASTSTVTPSVRRNYHPSQGQNTYPQGRCGSYNYQNRCGSKSSSNSKSKMVAAKPDNRLNMRIQPSAGIAYRPSTGNTLERNASSYSYIAGNWNTAIISGMALEFGKGVQRMVTLGVHYTKGLGNQGESITSDVNTKASADLHSSSSAWGLTIGVPFTLSKKKTPIKIMEPKQEYRQEKTEYKKKCGSYQGRCTRSI